jgi:hypothetical protein
MITTIAHPTTSRSDLSRTACAPASTHSNGFAPCRFILHILVVLVVLVVRVRSASPLLPLPSAFRGGSRVFQVCFCFFDLPCRRLPHCHRRRRQLPSPPCAQFWLC